MHTVLRTTKTTTLADLGLSSESEPSHQALAAGSDMECFNKISTCYYFLNWLEQTVRLTTTRE